MIIRGLIAKKNVVGMVKLNKFLSNLEARPPDIRDGERRPDYLTIAYKEIITTCNKYI